MYSFEQYIKYVNVVAYSKTLYSKVIFNLNVSSVIKTYYDIG